jgi:hypothetical protein
MIFDEEYVYETPYCAKLPSPSYPSSAIQWD